MSARSTNAGRRRPDSGRAEKPRELSQGQPRFPQGARWAVEAIAAFFMLTFTVPWQPVPEAPIGTFDFSWMLLLHDAVATGRQFGKQIILPQGPLGFIGTSVYDPRTYWLLIAGRSLAGLVAFWSIAEAGRKLVRPSWLALPWMLAIIVLMGASPDHFFPACAVLLIVNYFVIHERKLAPSSIVLIVVLGGSSLIKVNQPFYAITVVGAVTLDLLLQRRRVFWVPVVLYVGSFLFFYFAARQSPSSLATFLWGWWQVALGHADAVGLPGPLIDPMAYLVVVAMVVGLAGRFEWITRRWAAVLPVGAIAAVLLLLYKHSFMRQDFAHVHMGPMVAMATAMIYAAALWPRAGDLLRAFSLVIICVAGAVLSSILSSYRSPFSPSSLYDYVWHAPARCGENILAATHDLTDPSRLRREWEAGRRHLRDNNPLPLDKIEGTVDVYPHRQDLVFAYNLDYRPRPVVSSLVATATILADVNARHLLRPDAPQTILYDVEWVDLNYPTMLDGESIPLVLTRYDLIDSSGALLVLRKAAKPRSYRFAPLLSRTCRFNESIAIPPATRAPIWARIFFRKRTAGKLIAAIYKSPTLSIVVHTADGAETDYRLLPALAEQGFLLSPYLNDRHAFAKLMGKSWAKDLENLMVTGITISVFDGSQELSFDPEFRVELDGLEFDRQR